MVVWNHKIKKINKQKSQRTPHFTVKLYIPRVLCLFTCRAFPRRRETGMGRGGLSCFWVTQGDLIVLAFYTARLNDIQDWWSWNSPNVLVQGSTMSPRHHLQGLWVTEEELEFGSLILTMQNTIATSCCSQVQVKRAHPKVFGLDLFLSVIQWEFWLSKTIYVMCYMPSISKRH